MQRKVQYKVIVSDRARQMLAGHVQFLARKVLLLLHVKTKTIL